MVLYLWRFSAFGFQTIEHTPIVIFDVSWNAERVSLSQGERKSTEHLDRGTALRRVLLSDEELLAWYHLSCICIPIIYSEHSVSCRPIFQHERDLFHVVHACRCSTTVVFLRISWAAPTVTDGLVVEDPDVYPRLPDLNCLECLMWKHLEKGFLFICN